MMKVYDANTAAEKSIDLREMPFNRMIWRTGMTQW